MTTWYDPQELKDQADGDQIQPEFDPPPTPDYDDVYSVPDEEAQAARDALQTRMQEQADVVATFTQGPEDIQ